MHSCHVAGARAVLDRRRFLGGLAGAAGLLGLAACSGGADGSAGSSAGTGRTGTRSIATAKGRVEVPMHPKRVACVDPGFSWQALLEVGLTPVAVPFLVEEIITAKNLAVAKTLPSVVNGTGDIDLEKIAAARPDLILANAAGPSFDKIYPQLSAIAPVAAYAFRYPSDWVALNHSYAAAVNRAPQLAAVTARYDQSIADLKRRYATVIAQQKWALVTESGSQVFAWGSRSSAGPVLAAAGARFSAGAPDDATPFRALSLEKLDVLSDSTVLMYGAGAEREPYADTGRLLEQQVFRRLPAARAGHVYPLPSWFAYCYQDALGQLDGIERICRAL